MRVPAAPPGSTGQAPPLVVWMHGGAWMVGDRRQLPPTMTPEQIFGAPLAAGLAVATIDYRHACEAPFPAQLHDAKAAVRYLRHFAPVLGVDATRIGVWGESAGGHLAALVALTGDRADLEGRHGVTGPGSAVSAAVIWYGVSDVSTLRAPAIPPQAAHLAPPELLLDPIGVLLRGADQATREEASPLRHVVPGAPPFLLVHGTADQLIPHEQSVVLDEALRGAGVESRLVLVPGAGHLFLGHPGVDALVTAAITHFTAHLATPATA